DNKLELEDKYISLYNSNLDILRKDSPDFINNIRAKAFAKFKKLGIPSKKHEEYKYTNLLNVFFKNYKHYLSPTKLELDINEVFECDVPDIDTISVFLLNGWYYNNQKDFIQLNDGAVIGSLNAAFIEYPEIVKEHFGKYADINKDGLVALNTAFSKEGIFLYVPKGVILEKPIQIVNILMDNEDGMTQPRNLFVFDENSQASIVICDHTLSENNFVTNSVTEVAVGENSKLDFERTQNEHNGSNQISHLFFNQRRNSTVTSNTITLHGGLVRNNIYVDMCEEGCENYAYGLFLADKGQHIENKIFIDHAKPNCTSKQVFKAVLDDYSSGAFNGKVLVRPDAQNTKASQTSNNILLTDDAKINAKPQLEIYADDVKCNHGATVGQLDKEALFYLQSRGIGQKEAKLLLMYAFAYDVIDKIRVPALKERIKDLVERRLNGELVICKSCKMSCYHT
nr:Fe-S cluster assembly protein SufD [Bacteroidales bacterium]